jgi:hypothetical protein
MTGITIVDKLEDPFPPQRIRRGGQDDANTYWKNLLDIFCEINYNTYR